MWAMMLKLRMCAASMTKRGMPPAERGMKSFRLIHPHPPSSVLREDNGVHSEEKGILPPARCGTRKAPSNLPGQSNTQLQQAFRCLVGRGFGVDTKNRFRARTAQHEPGAVRCDELHAVERLD